MQAKKYDILEPSLWEASEYCFCVLMGTVYFFFILSDNMVVGFFLLVEIVVFVNFF